MPMPFVSRLHPAEYFALVISFALVGFEALIRLLTLALPPSLLSFFYSASRRLFHRYATNPNSSSQSIPDSTCTSPTNGTSAFPDFTLTDSNTASASLHPSSVRDASDFVDLCRLHGYTAEEHVVQTKDGYLLGLHRLGWKKGEESRRVNDGPDSLRKRVVYLHHGLMMNSEIWVCQTEARRSLPFRLVERGFDVWLGNNRGNKYSKKSTTHAPTNAAFWNFSIDEFALYDIPDSIAYVLAATSQPSLSYIGFSQGTAQAFAALSIHPQLNSQINVFIALAPAMSPAGLSNGVVDALIKASPQVLFLLFGRRSILGSAALWQSIVYPPIFVRLIDAGLSFLFNWQTLNISGAQKLAAYPHLYSYTSTKSVVHWFQIIRNKTFQMFDDDVVQLTGFQRSASKYTRVARYPTRNIKTPITLVYGGSDSLVDIKVMLKELPERTIATEVPHYEHLDFLWGNDVDQQVFTHVFDALDSFTSPGPGKGEFEKYQRARQASLSKANDVKKRAGSARAVLNGN